MRLSEFRVSPDTSIRECIAAIERNQQGLVVVIDNSQLLGTVTDGDIRRGLLRGLSLDHPARQVMNPNPVVAPLGTDRQELLEMMQQRMVRQIPLLDAAGRVVGLEVLNKLIAEPTPKANSVIILAGGEGKRLRPLTERTPKPLLPVDGKPLLQIIIEQLRSYGFHRLFLSVHYQAEQIEAHLGQGTQLGVEMVYLREVEPLGTAGPIRLAQEWVDAPFLVVNGDLLTRVNFERFLSYHIDSGYDLTMGIKRYDFEIPYGVIELSDELVVAIREKPISSCFINAGLYALSPSVVEYIPESTYFDMPDLIEVLLRYGRRVGGFPIHEYWKDIGRPIDYTTANSDFEHHFRAPER